MFHKVV